MWSESLVPTFLFIYMNNRWFHNLSVVPSIKFQMLTVRPLVFMLVSHVQSTEWSSKCTSVCSVVSSSFRLTLLVFCFDESLCSFVCVHGGSNNIYFTNPEVRLTWRGRCFRCMVCICASTQIRTRMLLEYRTMQQELNIICIFASMTSQHVTVLSLSSQNI